MCVLGLIKIWLASRIAVIDIDVGDVPPPPQNISKNKIPTKSAGQRPTQILEHTASEKTAESRATRARASLTKESQYQL